MPPIMAHTNCFALGAVLTHFSITRRSLLAAITAAGSAAALPFSAAIAQPIRKTDYAGALALLDSYAPKHLHEFGVPGLTLGMADLNGIVGTRTYGYADVKLKTPVAAQQMFQIASISKSFIALCLLALTDDGKLDFHKPITDYLPWLKIKTAFAPITTHHLLCHSSGLMNNGRHMPVDTDGVFEAYYAPNERFYYSNLGYTILGKLIEQLEQSPFTATLRRRIFEPLDMRSTVPLMSHDMLEQTVTSYRQAYDDRPTTRTMPLVESPLFTFDLSAGSIASTAQDMARYMRMLVRRGQGPRQRIVSEKSFALFSKAHIAMPGKNVGYGYGIMVDSADGRTMLRHTGGLVSFSSAMWIDMEAGVGAFASVNASRGTYRPNHVAKLAMNALAAARQNRALPIAPAFTDVLLVPQAADYEGNYIASGGERLRVIAVKDRLFLLHKGLQVAMEVTGSDKFIALHPDWNKFQIIFTRQNGPGTPVLELSHGGSWFAKPAYAGARTFLYPKEWESYVGLYRNEGPFVSTERVVIRKGKLLLGEMGELVPAGPEAFMIRDDGEDLPEMVRFADLANGKAWRMRTANEYFWRVREH